MRFLMLASALFCFCFGDALDSKLKNLIGERNYKINANFINKIFQDRNLFYTDGKLSMPQIFQTLRNNGLLNLRFQNPQEVSLIFSARTSPILLNRTINDILSSMGYSYFNVQKADYNDGISSIDFHFVTEHAPDPWVILSELEKRGLLSIDVTRHSLQKWEYLLELSSLQIPNSRTISLNEALSLRDISGQYWLNLQEQGKLKISNTQKWYPRVVFFDRNLAIVNSFLSKDSKTSITLKIPQGVSFIMITDFNNTANLKNGISIEFD
ncbi:MAG: hypothetical protein MR629_03790 [Helicobacter sp.]|nr:hypothetical protein [Helicobacter sp.]MCI7484507.1 hypothetical protein [Helicobacter sp.]MDD7567075.1 hypothetical protein [Helicobacter sp.]MDY5739956.1 hypothetical protein [Helicobacter sp.]